jgi:hydantoinase/carbamoylase family amidase
MTLAEAIKAFGQDPALLPAAAMRRGELLAYLEVHIEQGPVLERAGLPIGVVTAICGATRRRYRVKGMAGHAGTVPMEGRQDALVGAAEMVLAVEAVARAFGVVGTVGRIEALPGAVNVVPGGAAFTLDLRAERDGDRFAALEALEPKLAGIASARNLLLESETFHDSPSCLCDPRLIELFERATAAAGVEPRRLPSGAGHDAMAVAAIAPVGMLFVRCKGGISHNPAEAITASDAGLGQWALSAALDALAQGDYKAFA